MSEVETRGAPRPDQATIAAFVAVVLLGSLNAIAVKQSVTELAPFWSAGSRFVIAAILLLGLVLGTRRALPRGRGLVGTLAYGVIGFAGTFGFVYPALREVPAGTGMVFLALVPLLTFALAVLHGQERFRVQGLLGALIALAGVAVVFADQLSAAVPIGAMLAIIVGTVLLAEGSIILKSVPHSDPFSTNAVAMLAGGLVLLGLSTVWGEQWLLPTRPETWLAMGHLVLLGSIVLFALYLFALTRWTASAVSYVTLLMPLVTVPLAALLFSERVSGLLAVGGLLAVAGVYVGAFLHFRPRRTPTTILPECPPVQASAAGQGSPAR